MELLLTILIAIMSTVIAVTVDATIDDAVTDNSTVTAFMNAIADKKISFWQLLKVNVKLAHHSYLKAILKSFKKYVYINKLFKGIKIAVKNKRYSTARVLFSAIGKEYDNFNVSVANTNTSSVVSSVTSSVVSSVVSSVTTVANTINATASTIDTIALNITTAINTVAINITKATETIVSETIARNTKSVVTTVASAITDTLDMFAIKITTAMTDTSIGIIDALEFVSNIPASITYVKELKKKYGIGLLQLLKVNVEFAHHSKSSYLKAILSSFRKYSYTKNILKKVKIAVLNNNHSVAKDMAFDVWNVALHYDTMVTVSLEKKYQPNVYINDVFNNTDNNEIIKKVKSEISFCRCVEATMQVSHKNGFAKGLSNYIYVKRLFNLFVASLKNDKHCTAKILATEILKVTKVFSIILFTVDSIETVKRS